MADYNGDTRVILQRMGQQDKILGRLEANQEKNHEETQLRLRQGEVRLALLEKSDQNICDDIDGIKEKQDKNDLWTKIIGGWQGMITLILTYIGFRG